MHVKFRRKKKNWLLSFLELFSSKQGAKKLLENLKIYMNF